MMVDDVKRTILVLANSLVVLCHTIRVGRTEAVAYTALT